MASGRGANGRAGADQFERRGEPRRRYPGLRPCRPGTIAGTRAAACRPEREPPRRHRAFPWRSLLPLSHATMRRHSWAIRTCPIPPSSRSAPVILAVAAVRVENAQVLPTPAFRARRTRVPLRACLKLLLLRRCCPRRADKPQQETPERLGDPRRARCPRSTLRTWPPGTPEAAFERLERESCND